MVVHLNPLVIARHRATHTASSPAGASQSTSTASGNSPASFSAALGTAASQAAAQTASTAAPQAASAVPSASPAASPAASGPPTAQSVFGDNPWLTNPGGTGPNSTSYNYNPIYFATPATATKVAQMVGGQVVEEDAITNLSGPFVQNQPNEMVKLADGRLINAGIVASFYTHGYSQAMVDQMIANEVRTIAT